MKGFFITLEGIEGVGKSTHLQTVADYVKNQKIDAVITREPGGTLVAEAIRQVLLAHHQEPLHLQTELLLMFASRAQHLAQLIKPNLEAGKWVICDRFTDATYAYQGYGRGIPLAEIATLEQWVQGNLKPDLVLLLDAPVAVALQRTQKRGACDRFESESDAFFTRVREGYLARAEEFPHHYKIIDASLSVDAVRSRIISVLNEFRGQHAK